MTGTRVARKLGPRNERGMQEIRWEGGERPCSYAGRGSNNDGEHSVASTLSM